MDAIRPDYQADMAPPGEIAAVAGTADKVLAQKVRAPKREGLSFMNAVRKWCRQIGADNQRARQFRRNDESL